MTIKEELETQIRSEIFRIKRAMDSSFSKDDMSDATNNIAISNLYIALVNLQIEE